MQEVVHNVLGIIACLMSMIGGAIIIITYYQLPELKTFGNKMIMYVGISNLIYSMQTLIEFFFDLNDAYENNNLSTLCIIQGFISTYTSECVLIWITILSIAIYDTVKNKIVNMAKREIIFICLGFFIPLFLSSIPLFSSSYGYENGACWITSHVSQVAAQIQVWGLFYAPLWICIVLNFILIMKTLRVLKKLEIDKTETYTVIRRFLFYPILWIVCWIVGTVNRSIMVAGQAPEETLLAISEILISCQGFLTMVVFLSDKRVSDAIKFKFSKNSIEESEQDTQMNQNLNETNSEKNIFEDEDNETSYRKNKGESNFINQSCNSGDDNNVIHQANTAETHPTVILWEQKQNNDSELSNSNTTPLTNNEQTQSDTQLNLNQEKERNIQKPLKDQYYQRSGRPARRKSHTKSQKQQLQRKGQWNRMEMIEEDIDEDEFDKEIAKENIDNPEQLFLTKRDAKVLFKYRKQHIHESEQKNSQDNALSQ